MYPFAIRYHLAVVLPDASADHGLELGVAELNAVAGGDGFCYFIGGSDEPEVECGYMGYMCAYVGVTS